MAWGRAQTGSGRAPCPACSDLTVGSKFQTLVVTRSNNKGRFPQHTLSSFRRWDVWRDGETLSASSRDVFILRGATCFLVLLLKPTLGCLLSPLFPTFHTRLQRQHGGISVRSCDTRTDSASGSVQQCILGLFYLNPVRFELQP